MKIGLFFGSFNPIHTGHLITVNHILNETRLDKIWFIVSPLSPFKKNSDLLDEAQRLLLVNTAIQGDSRLLASDVEFHLPRPSFTINTLLFLKENFSNDEFSIIMGTDNFQHLDKWKNYKEIIAANKILVYVRDGLEVENKLNADIEVLSTPVLHISATEIRNLIEKGKSIRYLVPEMVRKQIEDNGYYKK